jgi:hypothetical protein
MTLWRRMSERSFDLFSVIYSVISLQCLYLGVSSISLLSVCCVLSSISLLSLSLCLISCPSNTVFASAIEDAFSHGCTFRYFGFATIWLLGKLQIRTRPFSSNAHFWSTAKSVTIFIMHYSLRSKEVIYRYQSNNIKGTRAPYDKIFWNERTNSECTSFFKRNTVPNNSAYKSLEKVRVCMKMLPWIYPLDIDKVHRKICARMAPKIVHNNSSITKLAVDGDQYEEIFLMFSRKYCTSTSSKT